MEELKIILIILSIAFLLFAGLCIPFLLQILRTAKSMDVTLQMFNKNLPGIMKNLEEITNSVNRTSAIVYRQVEDLSLTVSKIQGTLRLVVGMEEILRQSFYLPFAEKVRTTAAVAKGVRVFLDYLLRERPETRR
jgi:uncharacterized protein YoxC